MINQDSRSAVRLILVPAPPLAPLVPLAHLAPRSVLAMSMKAAAIGKLVNHLRTNAFSISSAVPKAIGIRTLKTKLNLAAITRMI